MSDELNGSQIDNLTVIHDMINRGFYFSPNSWRFDEDLVSKGYLNVSLIKEWESEVLTLTGRGLELVESIEDYENL